MQNRLSFSAFWTLASGTILGLALMMLLIFNNIGIISITDFTNRATMQNENKDPYGEKLAYGIAFNGSVDMQGINKSQFQNIV